MRKQKIRIVGRNPTFYRAFLTNLGDTTHSNPVSIALKVIISAFFVIIFYNIISTETNKAVIKEVSATDIVETKALIKNDNKEISKISSESHSVIIKWNNRAYAVNTRADRIDSFKELGLSDTRILDLLTILNLECNKYSGACFNGNDVGPLQINKIHKQVYDKSWEYYNKEDWGGLFLYQLKYANELLDSYESGNCKPEYIEKYGIGETYNQKRWRCLAFHYNGHPTNKFAYNKLGWIRRQKIKDLIYNKKNNYGHSIYR